MENKIILRRHLITLTPDVLLLFVSFVFLLEAIMSSGRRQVFLRGVSEVAAFFFLLIAILDVVKWMGFRVLIANGCVEVRKFWFFREEFCGIGRGVTIKPVQKGWDERLNMGTLVVYRPGSKVSTLDNLGDFDRVTGAQLLTQA